MPIVITDEVLRGISDRLTTWAAHLETVAGGDWPAELANAPAVSSPAGTGYAAVQPNNTLGLAELVLRAGGDFVLSTSLEQKIKSGATHVLERLEPMSLESDQFGVDLLTFLERNSEIEDLNHVTAASIAETFTAPETV
ncbi:hypothetical protein [Catenuloplanes japonicus]|uniref:hypothetical protein n=1 Tax=Catenuloplanes japonicus TaxID=33876 RepID=UPI00052656B1|nr:hypothetical protein [Catenuloplanes japonicus]